MDRITLIIVAMEEELQGVLNELKDYEVIESEIGKLYSFSKSGVNYILTLGKIPGIDMLAITFSFKIPNIKAPIIVPIASANK